MLPLKTDAAGKPLPIRNHSIDRCPSPEQITTFFRHGFAPGEEKYKVLLLTGMGLRCRIKEICALNIRDMTPNSNGRRWRLLLQKKKINEIQERELPEAIAAILREWILEHQEIIAMKGGYIFPHLTNNRSMHTTAEMVERWFCNKRKQLAKLFPDKGFGRVLGYHRYRSG